MKTPPKKSVVIAAVLSVAVVAGFTLAHAQEIPVSGDSIVALAAEAQSLPQVSAAATPARGGTYWWVYPGGIAVPTPTLPLDFSVPIYSVAENEYLVDLTAGTVSVSGQQLAAQSSTTDSYAAAVTAQVQSLVDLIVRIQTPTPVVTAMSLALTASPMDSGSGGFSPMDLQSGVPYLTIAPTNNSSFWITVWNDQGPANYVIWWTPVLGDPNYPWTAVSIGAAGQTNFIVPMPQFATGFYRAAWDTNSVPLWEAADPNNPSAGILSVYIDTPANGAVIQ
jgi:hypothetical protein